MIIRTHHFMSSLTNIFVDRYPDDTELWFDELPPETSLKKVPGEGDDKKDEYDSLTYVDGLDIAKRAASFAKGTFMEGMNKYKDLAKAKIKAMEGACFKAETFKEGLEDTVAGIQLECKASCTVLGPAGTNPACYPCLAKEALARGIYKKTFAKVKICEAKVTAAEIWITTHELGLWLFHYGLKVT